MLRWFRWAFFPQGPLSAGAVPDAGQSSVVVADWDVPADDTPTNVTFTARDAAGNALVGRAVVFTVEVSAVSAADSLATGTAEITDDGATSATVYLTARDANGDPLPDIPAASCVLAVTGTGNTVTQPTGVTDINGVISGSFVTTVAEAKTASWTVCGLAVTDTHAVTVSSGDQYALRAPAVDDYYLDPASGTDGVGSEADPWNVFTNAKLSTLVAGKILWVKNGTFDWATLSTLASGTAGSRIKIAAFPTHTPVATLSSSTVGFDDCYGFGATTGSADYWDIHGITFNLAGRAGIILGASQWSNPELTCSHVRFIDCIGNTTLAASDNGGIIFCDSNADYIEVVRGTYTATGASGGSGTNRALIWADYTKHIKLLGVLLNADGTSLPYYFKHTNAQTAAEVERVIQNCIVRNGSRGVLLCGKYFQLTNNVFDTFPLVDFGDQGGGDVGRGENTIVHNTFKGVDVGFRINAVGGENYDNVLRDNVITGASAELQDNPFAATDFRTVSSYNAYDSGAGRIRRNSTTYSLAGYQSAFPDRETNSIAGTIAFVGGGSEGDTPADWALTVGSIGNNAASDTTDIGVDATKLLTTTA